MFLDLGLESASDSEIWDLAGKDGWVIVIKDEDFVDWWLLSDRPVSLIWVREGNCSNRALLQWLDGLWLYAINRLQQGGLIVELNSL
jgi:predicted nuclease of predicted toxin-antitoxin system